MDTAPVKRYFARVWDDDPPASDLWVHQPRQALIAYIMFYLVQDMIARPATWAMEQIALFGFPQQAGRWVCRKPGQRLHRVDWCQVAWKAFTLVLPIHKRWNFFLHARVHLHGAVVEYFGVFAVVELLVIAALLLAALIAWAGGLLRRYLVRTPPAMASALATPPASPQGLSSYPGDQSNNVIESMWSRMMLLFHTKPSRPAFKPKPASKHEVIHPQQVPIPGPELQHVKEAFQAITAEPDHQHLSFEEHRLQHYEKHQPSQQESAGNSSQFLPPSSAAAASENLTRVSSASKKPLQARRLAHEVLRTRTPKTHNSHDPRSDETLTKPRRKKDNDPPPAILDLLTGTPRRQHAGRVPMIE